VILYKAPKSTFLGDLEESRIDQLLVEGFRDRLVWITKITRNISAKILCSDDMMRPSIAANSTVVRETMTSFRRV